MHWTFWWIIHIKSIQTILTSSVITYSEPELPICWSTYPIVKDSFFHNSIEWNWHFYSNSLILFWLETYNKINKTIIGPNHTKHICFPFWISAPYLLTTSFPGYLVLPLIVANFALMVMKEDELFSALCIGKLMKTVWVWQIQQNRRPCWKKTFFSGVQSYSADLWIIN